MYINCRGNDGPGDVSPPIKNNDTFTNKNNFDEKSVCLSVQCPCLLGIFFLFFSSLLFSLWLCEMFNFNQMKVNKSRAFVNSRIEIILLFFRHCLSNLKCEKKLPKNLIELKSNQMHGKLH